MHGCSCPRALDWGQEARTADACRALHRTRLRRAGGCRGALAHGFSRREPRGSPGRFFVWPVLHFAQPFGAACAPTRGHPCIFPLPGCASMCPKAPPKSLLLSAERPIRKGQCQRITPGATAPLQPLHSLAGPEGSGPPPGGHEEAGQPPRLLRNRTSGALNRNAALRPATSPLQTGRAGAGAVLYTGVN